MHLTNHQLVTFGISQAVIWLPLFAGHWARRRGWIDERRAKPLHALNLALLIPLIYALGVWRLDRSEPGWHWVPLIMTILMTFSTLAATWLTPRFIRHPPMIGTFTIMVPLSNMGHTLAGFITLLLYGDRGYALNSLLAWPMLLFNGFIWMPQACHWGQGGGRSFWTSICEVLMTGQSLIILGMLAGTALNFAGVPMGGGWVLTMKILVYAGTILTMFAIGCRLRLRRTGGYHRLLGWIYLVKFLVHPLVTLLLCLAFGIHGLPAGVLVTAACAPTGVNVVVFSTLYDLDVDLANAGYLWSTIIFMLIMLPLLLLLLQVPFFQTS